MFFKEQKIAERISEIKQLRYKNGVPIEGWTVVEDQTKANKYPPSSQETATFKKGDRWEGRDYYLWIETQIVVPKVDEKQRLLLFFDFGRTGGGYNSGFESLLFINGEPYQGVDSNHREVFLDAKYYGQTLNIALRLWSGLEGGGPEKIQSHQFISADLYMLDEATDDFYYTADVMLNTIKLLEETVPEKQQLLNVLNKSVNLVDWTNSASEEFYNSIEQANDILQDYLNSIDNNSLVNVFAIGHTHIDVAWLWRLKHTREKAVRSFSTVLRLMEQYPDYVFLQTQPQLYAFIKEDYPEIYKKIKARIDEGRWEVDGGMWLEADCNIPSGESFVRQLLMGSQFIKKEFGKEVNYLWLPDVFGYSWALPQILKKSGIDTFMTTKISWNQYNRMPNDTFKWRGIDGSDILTHFITTPASIDETEDTWYYTYNGDMDPFTVKGIYEGYRDKDLNSDLLLSYGYGDGGGGVTRDMLEKRRRIDQMPVLPNVKTGRADDYFKKLHQTIDATENYVHTWDGELYLEYHRGTYTSQASIKKWNRKLELFYRELELLLSYLLEKDARSNWKQELDEGWKIILRNQFHDIIPGSSIKEVYADAQIEYKEALAIGLRILNELKESFVPKSDTYTIINSAGWERTDFVTIKEKREGYFSDSDNQPLEVRRDGDTYQVNVTKIAGLGRKEIKFVEGSLNSSESNHFVWSEEQRALVTPFYEIQWNEAGEVARLYDVENGRDVLTPDGLGNYFSVFEDKPLNYDAWDIDLFYIEKSESVGFESVTLKEMNGLALTLTFNYRYNHSTLTQDVTVYQDNRRIDFSTSVDWHERQKLLKVGFDVAVRNTEATFDIQYGNVKRPTHWNTSWDMARFESIAHQWVDLSDRTYGVSLLNDCKYGHDIKGNRIGLSLLKGAIYPDPTADLGLHEFKYSLYPHKGDFVEAGTVEQAWAINQALTVFNGTLAKPVEELIKIDSEYPVVIDSIKPSEDGEGIILRVHDHIGAKRQLILQAQFDHELWIETNLMEQPLETSSKQTGDIVTELEPYEIKTFFFKTL